MPLTRRKIGNSVGIATFVTYGAMARRMIGDFQAERLAVQVGETLGRAMAAGSDTKGILKNLVTLIEGENLGSVELVKSTRDRPPGYELIGLFSVSESAEAFGTARSDKPVCHMLRGLIRGALAGVYHQENIAVKENKCTAMGGDKCEFEAYWIPM